MAKRNAVVANVLRFATTTMLSMAPQSVSLPIGIPTTAVATRTSALLSPMAPQLALEDHVVSAAMAILTQQQLVLALRLILILTIVVNKARSALHQLVQLLNAKADRAASRVDLATQSLQMDCLALIFRSTHRIADKLATTAMEDQSITEPQYVPTVNVEFNALRTMISKVHNPSLELFLAQTMADVSGPTTMSIIAERPVTFVQTQPMVIQLVLAEIAVSLATAAFLLLETLVKEPTTISTTAASNTMFAPNLQIL